MIQHQLCIAVGCCLQRVAALLDRGIVGAGKISAEAVISLYLHTCWHMHIVCMYDLQGQQ